MSPTIRPLHLLSGLAQEAWDKAIADLGARGILESVDAGLLTGYARLAGRCGILEKRLELEGPTLSAPQGESYPNPLVAMLGETRETLFMIADELSLTPASRARMTRPDSDV